MKRACFFYSLVILSSAIVAQDYQLSFEIQGDNETLVDSVVVGNIEQGNSITLMGNDVLHLIPSTTGIADLNITSSDIEVYPNPFSDRATIVFQNEKHGPVQLTLFDMAGKIVAQKRVFQSMGSTIVEIEGLAVGAYVIQIDTKTSLFSEVILSNCSSGNNPEIIFAGPGKENAPSVTTLKSSKRTSEMVDMTYNSGETLSLTAYLDHLNSEIRIIPVTSSNISFDFHPNFFDGTVSSSETIQDIENFSYENPFIGVELHDPTSIGLVKIPPVSAKKSVAQMSDEGSYFLYEVTGDTMAMLKGQEGNNISFSNIERVERISDTWMLFTGWITLECAEQEIYTSYDVKTDSIFIVDTVAIADAGRTQYNNSGDSIFFGADTIVYKDTLWIQARYGLKDTINYNSNTTQTFKSNNYAGLLLNLKSGKLYEMGIFVQTTIEYFALDFHDYDPVSNKVFFWVANDKLGILDLNKLQLEQIEVPITLDEMGRFAVIDDDKILTPYAVENKYAVYIMGSGLRTKTNYAASPQTFLHSSHWRGKNNKRYLFRDNNGSQVQLYTMEFRNDSMIFEEVDMEVKIRNFLPYEEHYGDPYFTGAPYPEGIGTSIKHHRLYINGERWVVTGHGLWNFNEESGVLKLFTELNWEGLTTDGVVSYYYDEANKKVLSLDLADVIVSEVLDINNLTDDYLIEPGMTFKVSKDGNFLISCTRMYDFQKVVIEYDGTSGEKLNEWELESAPLESVVSSLTQVF